MADSKVSALTANTTVAATDILYLVDDPGGTPASQKATVDNVMKAFDHGARVYHNANQSIADITATVLAFNSERYDTDAYHDVSTNNSRLTVPSGQAGKYLITANVRWDVNATGTRFVYIRLNGTTLIGMVEHEANAAASRGTVQNVSTVYSLAETDYVEVLVFQSSGGALNLTTTSNLSPEFMLQRLA